MRPKSARWPAKLTASAFNWRAQYAKR